ncbi:helix-turn-helix domain-containing protein [Sphingobacterium sp. SYP-B4668]|uniref:helix-turn-helix domain-containing protein n=1 Tax=Sphingobacterium sp. SYP-B4668 TaxID=2996035 RepID=UPI0022DCE724|nr:helix-turn-helix domain-containing protein [Sphingobacterium sp. SYP-B4668]
MSVLYLWRRFTVFEILLTLILLLQLVQLGIICLDGHFPLPLLYGPLYWSAYRYYSQASIRQIQQELVCGAVPFLWFGIWYLYNGNANGSVYFSYYIPLALIEQLVYPVMILYGLYRKKTHSMQSNLLRQLMALAIGTLIFVLVDLLDRYGGFVGYFDFNASYTVAFTMGVSIFMLGYYLFGYHLEDERKTVVREESVEQREFSVVHETTLLLVTIMERDQLYLNPKLTLSDIAAYTKLRKAEISQCLNIVLGQSYYEWLAGYRVQYAIRLLGESGANYKLEAIAHSCGFSSKTTFVQYFKEIVGILPSTYRNDLLTR